MEVIKGPATISQFLGNITSTAADGELRYNTNSRAPIHQSDERDMTRLGREQELNVRI